MTEQPREIKALSSADDITTFLGRIPGDEYEQRRRIRTARNAAVYKATQTTSQMVRQICWMVTDTATEWIYSPADVSELTEIAVFLRRLLVVADQANVLGAP